MSVEPRLFSSLFEDLSAFLDKGQTLRLLEALEERRANTGSTLLQEGFVSDELYLVLDGALRVFLQQAGKEAVIGMVYPGAVLGEVGFLDGLEAGATVQPITKCQLLVLNQDRFQELEEKNPILAGAIRLGLCRVLARRIRAGNEQIEALRSGGRDVATLSSPMPQTTLGSLRELFGARGS